MQFRGVEGFLIQVMLCRSDLIYIGLMLWGYISFLPRLYITTLGFSKIGQFGARKTEKSFYNYLKKRLKSLSSLTNNFQNSKLEYVDVVDCPCNLTFQDEKIFLWHDDYLKIGKSALRKI